MNSNSPTPIEKYWLCALYSFDCDVDRIELNEGIEIKHAPDKLQKYLYEQTFHLYGLWSNPSDVTWAVCLPYKAQFPDSAPAKELIKIGLAEEDRALDLLFDLGISLKLLHKGHVVLGPLISASTNNSIWSVGGEVIWTPISKRDFILEKPLYKLLKSEAAQINALMNDLKRLREGNKIAGIAVSLRRFHSSYHGDIEDRIIDQMIAFESLYTGDPQELKYRLALRTALLLAKRLKTRRRIFDDMKEAYNLRSKLVHGETVSRDELRAIINKTEDYLRQSIRKYVMLLSEGKQLKNIREKLLDENILCNGKLLS